MTLRSLALSIVLAGCSHGEAGTAAPPSASATSSSSGPSASAAPSASSAPTGPVTWKGTYRSRAGSLYVYDGGEWKGFHFRGDDASTGLGEGDLVVTVDRTTGLLHGTASGAIGDAVVTGQVNGAKITFSILRKDPKDRGLTGTGYGQVDGSSATGEMKLSRGDAHVIRDATFTLSKAPP